jgi:hypothetical protein
MSKWLTSAAVVVALALTLSTAHADQYDGKWAFEFSAPNGITGSNQGNTCAGMRIIVDVTNDQISGSLARMENSPTEMINSAGPGAEPLSGTIAPDGTLSASWQDYTITGKLDGNGGRVQVTGECGPRAGKAMRMTD